MPNSSLDVTGYEGDVIPNTHVIERIRETWGKPTLPLQSHVRGGAGLAAPSGEGVPHDMPFEVLDVGTRECPVPCLVVDVCSSNGWLLS